MGLWKREKKKAEQGGAAGRRDSGAASTAGQAGDSNASSSGVASPGVVSSVLSSPGDPLAETPFGDVVSRRFGPASVQAGSASRLPPQHARGPTASEQDTTNDSSPQAARDARDRHRAVETLFGDQPATPELEVDLMAHIGRETTITGDIVAEEDLEIQGTVEGSVRLANHQVTVGSEGHVKASVDAQIVMVYGRITGDVVASELVEVEKGGIVGGDIKSPRVIMHDGAIVIGGLDMSASLPNSGEDPKPAKERAGAASGKTTGPVLEAVEAAAEFATTASRQESVDRDAD